jgi:hypothetical protein
MVEGDEFKYDIFQCIVRTSVNATIYTHSAQFKKMKIWHKNKE